MNESDKRVAAEAAMNEVRSGMLIGLGTGSTATEFIRALATGVKEGLRIEGTTATSEASAALAWSLGLPVIDFARLSRVDLTVDGVDEIDAGCRAIKGAGGAMVRERIVAAAASRMVAIADGSKRVDRLGGAKLPVEVLPFAQSFVARRLIDRGLEPMVRVAQGERFATDNGNMVLDCLGVGDHDPGALAAWLDQLPGVVGHGLFLTEIAAAYVASVGRVTRLDRAVG